jgi:hypothetical protein
MTIKTLFLTASFFLSTSVLAKSYMKIGTVYMAETSAGATTTRHWLDVGGGYLTKDGLSFGLLYSSEKTSYADGYNVDRTSYGPSVGWANPKDSGFFALATYLMSSKLTNNYKGKGYQLDIGYRFALDKVSFAPQISKKEFNYDYQNDQSLNSTYNEGRIDPYFVVWVDF